jgi:hypothetical protein
MILNALLYFASFAAILILFASIIAVFWLLLKKTMRGLGRLVRALADE